MQNSIKPIRIGIMGMDEHARNMYDLVLSKHATDQYILADLNQAEACLFDLDSYGAQKLWDDFRHKYPSLPALVLSLREKQFDNSYFVKKPINIKQFLQTLDSVKKAVEEQRQYHHPTHATSQPISSPAKPTLPSTNAKKPTKTHHAGHLMADRQAESSRYASKVEYGQLPDIDPHKPEQVEKIYYDMKQHFQNLFEQALLLAKEKKSCVLLEGFIGKIIIHPQQNQVLCTSTEDTLHSLMLLPMQHHNIEVQRFDCVELSYHIQSTVLPFNYNYLDQFRWKLAIWAAHGRIPIGTALETPIILLHWPNLTRLLLTPYALQIAALWIERPFSLIDTAKHLNIPQKYVFTFYSAVHTLGLAFPERRGEQREKDERYDITPENIFDEHKHKRNLFKRILSRLSFSH